MDHIVTQWIDQKPRRNADRVSQFGYGHLPESGWQQLFRQWGTRLTSRPVEVWPSFSPSIRRLLLVMEPAHYCLVHALDCLDRSAEVMAQDAVVGLALCRGRRGKSQGYHSGRFQHSR
jgi:hypothetical protein